MVYQTSLFHVNNNRAVALLMLGRYSEAIVALEKSLATEENALTYKNLGDAYYSIGINEKAVYNYEKSISLKPSGETYYNLAVCLFVQQNFHNSLIMA
jgi:tetratricopeptide (TPR) repeat protein